MKFDFLAMNRSYRNTIFLLLITVVNLWGQGNPYPFKHLSTGDGLSQSSVIAIEQDRLGQMWLGTRDGLNRYDGNTFKVFRNDPKDSTSISNSDILSIQEDADGDIWIGTYNGLNRYDPVKHTFKRYLHSDVKNSLANNTVWCVSEMQNGEIWAGTSNGLSIYDKTKNRFTNFSEVKNKKVLLPSEYVLSMLQTKKGIVWVGTSKGLCKVERTAFNGFSFRTYRTNEKEVEFIVQDIKECGKDTLCVATKNHGLLRFDSKSEVFVQKPTESSSGPLQKDVRALTFDAKGNLWMGTSNGIRILSQDGSVTKITHDPDRLESLSHDYIKSLFTDKKGSIWIGSYYGGVDIWDESNTNFINYTQTSAKNSMGHKVVSSIATDPNQNRYFGTEGNGITIFKANGKNTTYLNLENSPALLSNNIKSLFIDHDKLWVGSFDEGAFVYDLNKKRFEKKTMAKELGEYLKKRGYMRLSAEATGKFG